MSGPACKLALTIIIYKVTPSISSTILNKKAQKTIVIGNYTQKAISYKISM